MDNALASNRGFVCLSPFLTDSKRGVQCKHQLEHDVGQYFEQLIKIVLHGKAVTAVFAEKSRERTTLLHETTLIRINIYCSILNCWFWIYNRLDEAKDCNLFKEPAMGSMEL